MAKLNTKIVMLEGEQGKDGTNIKSVEKSASDGLTDTYTITLTDGSKSTFNVTNGKGIKNIEKASTIGLVDTYTITYNDETTSTFTVTNGKGADSIQSQIVPTASIESGATASKAYSSGDLLAKDGILYKVTKAIAKDDTLTVGGNIESDTLAGEINSLLDKMTYKDISNDIMFTKSNLPNLHSGTVTKVKALRRGENVRVFFTVKPETDHLYGEGESLFIGDITIKGLKIRMGSTSVTWIGTDSCIYGEIDEGGFVDLEVKARFLDANTLEHGYYFDLIVE